MGINNCTLDTHKINKRSSFLVVNGVSDTSSSRSTPSTHLHELMTKQIRKRSVFKDYKLIKKIGEGSMGSVSVVQKKNADVNSYNFDGCFNLNVPTSHVYQYALKTIKFGGNPDPSLIEELINEINIIRSLDHPNIVRAIETYEYRDNVAIVMELCTGGDLYSRVPYTEARAQHIVRQITSTVAYMHRCGIMHRDLKFENIMFESLHRDADVKIIDYGLSVKFEYEGEHLREGCGTVYSMAPEVLDRNYDSQADLWSIGVISFMLLSCSMPFDGITRADVMRRMRMCQYSFSSPRWSHVSAEGRRFVAALIVKNPKVRLNADQALRHPWLDADFKKQEALFDDKSIPVIMSSIVRYASCCKLKKLALLVVAHKSTCNEIGELREAFEKFDSLRNGTVCFDEFKEVLMKSGHRHADDELRLLFNSIDLAGNGLINYTEFIAATIEARGAINDERLKETFCFFDCNNTGYITKDTLKNLMQYGLSGRSFTDEYVDEVIGECDLNADGIISFHEFMSLWGRPSTQVFVCKPQSQ